MNQDLNERLLAEARRIGNLLLAEATDHTTSLSWPSYQLGYHDELESLESSSLSHGSAGIALYLLDLAQTTGDTRYEEAALKAARHAADHCQQQPGHNYSF